MPMCVEQLSQLSSAVAEDPVIVSGGPGNDTINIYLSPSNPSEWPDVIDGAGGFDTLNLAVGDGSVSANFSDLSRPAIVTVTGVLSTPIQISVVNFEQFSFEGEHGNDRIQGARYNDTLIGGGGDNTLIGGAGDDILDGGTPELEFGADLLMGGAGNDTLLGLGYDYSVETVFGGPGSDTFQIYKWVFETQNTFLRPAVSDIIGDFQPGPGGDVLRFEGVDASSPVRLVGGTQGTTVEAWFYRGPGRGDTETYGWLPVVSLKTTNLTLLTDDNIPGIGSAGPAPVGTSLADTLRGTALGDVISAAGGNDTVQGMNGNDTLNGGVGDDSLDGGVGQDLLNGGTGHDVLFGNLEEDTLIGGLGNDSLLGDFGADLLQGQAGDDTLLGGRDADTLLGGDGNDSISGENGSDVIRGGAGDDTLTGGPEFFTSEVMDVFFFGAADVGVDRITDFQVGLDRLDLNGLGIYNSAAALAVADDSAGGAVITVGGVSITLEGVSVSLLAENSDFVV